MNMSSNLTGRLRNTSLPNNRGLSPLFEAVINSIHAIEEANISTDKGNVSVEIIRDTQQSLSLDSDKRKRGPDPTADIIGFKITDNGIGFNKANMDSFNVLDTDYKIDKGCRGVGRLL